LLTLMAHNLTTVLLYLSLLLQLLNGLFSRTYDWVNQYQKDRTILDFNEARDDGVAVASARSYTNHLHFTPDRRSKPKLTIKH